jgi:hypothetical protein
MSSRLLASAVTVVALSGSAHASVITTNSQALWNWRVTNGGQVVGTESFNDLSGYYDAPVTDTLGNVVWTASATGGLYVDNGLFSTNFPVPLTFDFNPGVRAVAGNIFGTDVNFNSVSCIVSVTLANGVTYEGISSGPSDFIGFYSTAADISTMTIVAVPLVNGQVYATIDNLYLAVPAPGAAALIGLAGLVARRRRA